MSRYLHHNNLYHHHDTIVNIIRIINGPQLFTSLFTTSTTINTNIRLIAKIITREKHHNNHRHVAIVIHHHQRQHHLTNINIIPTNINISRAYRPPCGGWCCFTRLLHPGR